MRSFIAAVPLSVVAAALAVVAAALLAPRAAAKLRTRLPIAFLLLVSTGLVLAATIVPDADALFAGVRSDGTCDLSRLGLASIGELTSVTTSSLNVLLFIPLGVSIAWLPRTRRTALIVAMAFSLTFVVEGIQLAVTMLGRGCQSADVADNLLGLVIGLSVGLAARLLIGETRLLSPNPPMSRR